MKLHLQFHKTSFWAFGVEIDPGNIEWNWFFSFGPYSIELVVMRK